jgi:hypothetical protein
MNIFGHSYVATRAVKGNNQLLIAGSLLPELSPFVANSPFTWEEIHEGGEKLLSFCRKEYPEMIDLAWGVLSHSAEYGADKFNKEIENYAGRNRDRLLLAIAQASSIDTSVAASRLHNFLWWGVDVQILQNIPDFVSLVKKALSEVDIDLISKILSKAFTKNEKAVANLLRTLFKDIYRKEDLDSVEGLARVWSRQARGLPEGDIVDTQKAALVFNDCAEILKDSWETVLEKVVAETKQSLKTVADNLG